MSLFVIHRSYFSAISAHGESTVGNAADIFAMPLAVSRTPSNRNAIEPKRMEPYTIFPNRKLMTLFYWIRFARSVYTEELNKKTRTWKCWKSSEIGTHANAAAGASLVYSGQSSLTTESLSMLKWRPAKITNRVKQEEKRTTPPIILPFETTSSVAANIKRSIIEGNRCCVRAGKYV